MAMSPTTAARPTSCTGAAVYKPGVIVSTIEECGAQVRWKGSELQQVWIIRHIGTTGAVEKITHEWRAVPQEN